MTEIKSAVRSFIADSILMTDEVRGIADDTSFLSAQIIDSTGILELIEFLERQFQIKVADADMVPENLDSLNAIERYVLAKGAS